MTEPTTDNESGCGYPIWGPPDEHGVRRANSFVIPIGLVDDSLSRKHVAAAVALMVVATVFAVLAWRTFGVAEPSHEDRCTPVVAAAEAPIPEHGDTTMSFLEWARDTPVEFENGVWYRTQNGARVVAGYARHEEAAIYLLQSCAT